MSLYFPYCRRSCQCSFVPSSWESAYLLQCGCLSRSWYQWTHPLMHWAMQCSYTMSIATRSASSMDHLCATGLLRLIPSLSLGYSTAPDPHEPSLKVTIVVSIGSPIRSFTTSLLSSVCSAVVYWVSNKIFYHLFAFLSLFSCCFLSYTKLQNFYFLLSPKKYHALFFLWISQRKTLSNRINSLFFVCSV